MPEWTIFIAVGIVLIILGFFLIAFGMILSANKSKIKERNFDKEIEDGSVKGGGVVLIGPVPIVFGTDKRFAIIAMILKIVIMLLAVIFLE